MLGHLTTWSRWGQADVTKNKNEPETIEAARRFADKEVKDFLSTEGGVRRGPMAIVCWWGFSLSWRDSSDGLFVEVPSGADEAIVSLAWRYADVRDLVLQVIASRIACGQTLTRPFRQFASLALTGSLPKPDVKRGPKSSDLFERNLFIIEMLKAIKANYGLDPTHNDSRKPYSARLSGAEIVSECFCGQGRHEVTPRTVKEVWKSKTNQRWAERIGKKLADYSPQPRNALAAVWGAN